MTRDRIKRLVQFVAAPVIALALVGAITDATGPLAIINETPSLPRGLYARSAEPLSHGAIVAFAQPAAARAYLQTLGYPESAYLLKRVTGLPGEAIAAEALPQLAADRRGVALPQTEARTTLAEGEVFVTGDTGARSFDSRYFGPLRIADTVGTYRLVASW
jgi:type IV secretory pathway protease TraF